MKALKLTEYEIAELCACLGPMLQTRQEDEQRLIPLEEAQSVADALDRIKGLLEELARALHDGEPNRSIWSRMNSAESECNSCILRMKAHFERGRIRPKSPLQDSTTPSLLPPALPPPPL